MVIKCWAAFKQDIHNRIKLFNAQAKHIYNLKACQSCPASEDAGQFFAKSVLCCPARSNGH